MTRVVKVARIVRGGVDRFDTMLNFLARIALIALLALALYSAVSRYFLQRPPTGALGISQQYLMPIIVLFSLSFTELTHGHVRIELVRRKLSERVRQVTDTIGALLAAAFFAAISYASFLQMQGAYQRQALTSGDIRFPLYTALMIAPIAAALMTVRLCLRAAGYALPRLFGTPDSETSLVDDKASIDSSRLEPGV